jgi:hypothetical protein
MPSESRSPGRMTECRACVLEEAVHLSHQICIVLNPIDVSICSDDLGQMRPYDSAPLGEQFGWIFDKMCLQTRSTNQLVFAVPGPDNLIARNKSSGTPEDFIYSEAEVDMNAQIDTLTPAEAAVVSRVTMRDEPPTL